MAGRGADERQGAKEEDGGRDEKMNCVSDNLLPSLYSADRSWIRDHRRSRSCLPETCKFPSYDSTLR